MREHERRTTVAEFEHGLVGVLQHLVTDPGRWILIADVEASHNRYVQFHCDEDGELNAEVVSNRNLEGDERWSEDEEVRLVEAGWRLPGEGYPNYWRAGDAAAVESIGEATMAVVRGMFDFGEEDWLVIRLFRSPRDHSLPPNRSADPVS